MIIMIITIVVITNGITFYMTRPDGAYKQLLSVFFIHSQISSSIYEYLFPQNKLVCLITLTCIPQRYSMVSYE